MQLQAYCRAGFVRVCSQCSASGVNMLVQVL